MIASAYAATGNRKFPEGDAVLVCVFWFPSRPVGVMLILRKVLYPTIEGGDGFHPFSPTVLREV